MAISPNESAAQGMFDAVKNSEGIFGSTNKTSNATGASNIDQEDEYESKMSDEEILELTDQWKRTYEPYYAEIKPTQEKAFRYWLGKQPGNDLTLDSSNSDPNPLVDNVIFTAVETFLPLATRANPDPVVSADPSENGQYVSKALRTALGFEADRQKLRRKLARMLRRWSWDRLGVAKISWDFLLKEIKTEIISAKRMIFDKDGYIDEGGRFRGEYIGEKKKESARRLAEMFPKKATEIRLKAEGKMATKLEFIEWWYKGRELFYTLDDNIVLGKYKNPNWNYDVEVERQAKPEGEEAQIEDTIGSAEAEQKEEEKEIQEGKNYHKEPLAPYVFLSIFSSGQQPYDETSLILQNIQLQDIVNKLLRQVDHNVRQMNNGMLLSGKSFDSDQASGAANALAKGQAILVPDGDVHNGAARFAPGELPQSVFRFMDETKSEIMNIYGTAGSTPQGLEEQKSVRGKIMVNQQDTSRIGGTITEQLEQVADSIYNWWVQMMYVYFDDEHLFATAGLQGQMETLMLRNIMFASVRNLSVTVKEGSLIPKDPLTQRNEAMDLWSANAIDPLNFYKRLDVSDPVAMTQSLILWQLLQKGAILPQAYLPSFQIGVQGQLGQVPAPAVNPSTPAQNLTPQVPGPGTPEAVGVQERQLLQSVPLLG